MTPTEFLKSKNIPEPTYNGVRLVDNVEEQPIVLDISDNIVNVIFQY